MGFDLGGTINAAADWLCSAPIIRGVVSNPIFTALLITALAVIVVMALYHYQIKRAGMRKGIRAVLYVFLAVLAVTFVHHYAVTRCARESAAQKGVRDVFAGIHQSRVTGIAAVPVPTLGEETPPPQIPVQATGGNGEVDPDCGCPLAGGGKDGARPDNVALGDLVIEDVVLPATTSPFGAGK